MAADPRVFLDTSVLIAGVMSRSGGSRLILKLGESRLIQPVVGRRVLFEADRVLKRKLPEGRPLLAALLGAARVSTAPRARRAERTRADDIVSYAPDAAVLAEALAARPDYFVTLDKKHFAGGRAKALPFRVGTPGEFLEWFREQLAQTGS